MRKAGIVFMLLGSLLIFSALGLFGYNQLEDQKAGAAAEEGLITVKAYITDTAESESTQLQDSAPLIAAPVETPVVVIDGYGYIGYLSIPALDLELPLMDTWDYDRLKIAPCRQFGSLAENNLVIAGHNYKSHFATLNSVQPGDMVVFTDMNGTAYPYCVDAVTIIQPTDVDAVQNTPWDMVLYTCTFGGEQRVCVGCKRI